MFPLDSAMACLTCVDMHRFNLRPGCVCKDGIVLGIVGCCSVGQVPRTGKLTCAHEWRHTCHGTHCDCAPATFCTAVGAVHVFIWQSMHVHAVLSNSAMCFTTMRHHVARGGPLGGRLIRAALLSSSFDCAVCDFITSSRSCARVSRL